MLPVAVQEPGILLKPFRAFNNSINIKRLANYFIVRMSKVPNRAICLNMSRANKGKWKVALCDTKEEG